MTRATGYLTAALLTIATVLGLAGTANAASGPPASYFGLHYSHVAEGSWPHAPVGSIRLWDTGTSWRDVEPQRGVWDWSRLDAAVVNARSHGAVISLVLGFTPAWASNNLNAPGPYGAATTAPSNRGDWTTYVSAVATRYRGQIASYETWNEANLTPYWTGSLGQIVALSRAAYGAIKAADPAATVISPGVGLRYNGIAWLGAYARAGGMAYADVVAVHGYPKHGETPEVGLRRIDQARATLARAGVHKPIWDTETNLETGTVGSLTMRQQRAQVARYYLLAWTHGVGRVGWYDWSAAGYLGVHLAAHNGSTKASPAGRAFRTVRSWMQGRHISCRTHRHVHVCKISGRGVVKWHVGGKVRVTAPSHRVMMLSGHHRRVGRHAHVGDAPVLFVR